MNLNHISQSKLLKQFTLFLMKGEIKFEKYSFNEQKVSKALFYFSSSLGVEYDSKH